MKLGIKTVGKNARLFQDEKQMSKALPGPRPHAACSKTSAKTEDDVIELLYRINNGNGD